MEEIRGFKVERRELKKEAERAGSAERSENAERVER